MRHAYKFRLIIVTLSSLAAFASTALAFEGRISAVMVHGSQTNALLYTVGTNSLRAEMTATNWPNPVDILDRNSGVLTLLFLNNHSFMRLPPTTETARITGAPGMPAPSSALPPGSGPRSAAPGVPAMPAMPNMPALPPGVGPQSAATPGATPGFSMPIMPGMMEKAELEATGQVTNLLGFACQRYELKQHGESMEIWATDQLLPYQPYLQNQPHRFGPRRIEEQWGQLLANRKLFPLLASLRYDNGTERFRFEVTSVTPQKLADEDAKLFQPPSGWFEMRPPPF
jgi:hypothetical protein